MAIQNVGFFFGSVTLSPLSIIVGISLHLEVLRRRVKIKNKFFLGEINGLFMVAFIFSSFVSIHRLCI